MSGHDGGRPERRIWRPDVRKDVADELAFHLEQRQREYAERGLAPAAARAEAERRFGNLTEVAATCRAIDEAWYREQRRASMWTDFRQDVGYGARSLWKSPGFTLVALLTLALGIGANTAIFSAINAVLLRPLPYYEADRLVFVWSSSREFQREPLTPGRLVDFREQLTTVEALAGISHLSLNLTGSGDPERLTGSSVSSNFFDVLGVRPLIGDTFHGGRADERDVVLGHRLWTRRFGAAPSIVGSDITINGRARRVVGVMGPEFDWPSITATRAVPVGPELWIPAAHRDIPRTPADDPNEDLSTNRSAGYLRAVARLKPGVSVEQAQHEAEAMASRLAQAYPEMDGGRGAIVYPMREQFFGSVRRPLLVLLGAVAFVLAIACANAASLLLGRAAARRKEVAVRLALGAGRGRIIRQLLTESLLLASGGAVAGLLLAVWSKAWLMRIAPDDLTRLEASRIDPTVLVFTLSVALVTGILFGIVPAWQVSAGALNEDLNEGGTRGSAGPRTSRTRDLLIGAQICVALVLLIGAGLLLRSFAALSHVDTGIAAHNLLAFDVVLSGQRAEYQRTQVAFYDEALREIRSLPGVRGAGAAATLPIGGDDFGAGFTIEGRPRPRPGDEPRAGYQVVTPGYFDTIGVRLIAGREFAPSDTREAPPVVMVNETLARQHWPSGDALGRRLWIGRSQSGPPATVIGVVSDIRHLGPATPPRPEIYEVHSQRSFSFMAFVVRADGDPYALVPSIRAGIARLDPAQPISGVRTMEEHIERSLSRPRFMSVLTAAFGGLALLLSVVGIYGVMAYSVAQRTREIAIRAALGARRADVLRLVLSKALALALLGVAAGLATALALTRVLSGLLFGVTATDPLTYATVAALLIAVALLAGAVPAVRAARIDGARLLRS